MTTIVVLNIGGNMLRVECDGLARDNILPKNIVLTGCKELDTEARDGGTLDTKMWSVPESLVMSYAVGKASAPAPVAVPVEAPVAAPAEAEVPTLATTLTEEQKEARRQRYARRDEETRSRRGKPLPTAEVTEKEAAPRKKGGRRKRVADPTP
jgi:hypothetical protein